MNAPVFLLTTRNTSFWSGAGTDTGLTFLSPREVQINALWRGRRFLRERHKAYQRDKR